MNKDELIKDIHKIIEDYVWRVEFTEAREAAEEIYRYLDLVNKAKLESPYSPEYVAKYKDALREINTFPARDIAENWNAEQWANFYKQDIDKLQRIASKALYEVKI
jgi:hypothetical protein